MGRLPALIHCIRYQVGGFMGYGLGQEMFLVFQVKNHIKIKDIFPGLGIASGTALHIKPNRGAVEFPLEQDFSQIIDFMNPINN
jgi:hypothetical protein